MNIKPVSRKTNIVVQEMDDEVLIYDLDLNKAFCLNQTAGIIWQMCDGAKTVAEISQAAGKKLETNVSEDLVWLALEQFKKDNLISNEFESVFEGVFKGQTRREVIRKAALASIVALPIVASIIAPTSVNAQSCIAFFQPCTTSPTGGGCCPESICENGTNICGCMCDFPADCLTKTGCPNTANCNTSHVCAP